MEDKFSTAFDGAAIEQADENILILVIVAAAKQNMRTSNRKPVAAGHERLPDRGVANGAVRLVQR